MFGYNSHLIAQDMESSLTMTAYNNHKELWLNYEARTKATDSEPLEVFYNFTFDKIIGHDKMDIKRIGIQIVWMGHFYFVTTNKREKKIARYKKYSYFYFKVSILILKKEMPS